MRTGTAVTVYLGADVMTALDREVERQAQVDREKGLTGYSVTNRSKLTSRIITNYFLSRESEGISFAGIQELAAPICKQYGVMRADLIGSYARGDQKLDDPICIIVNKECAQGLQFFNIERDLGLALGKNVQLKAYGRIPDDELQAIEQERRIIYAQ